MLEQRAQQCEQIDRQDDFRKSGRFLYGPESSSSLITYSWFFVDAFGENGCLRTIKSIPAKNRIIDKNTIPDMLN